MLRRMEMDAARLQRGLSVVTQTSRRQEMGSHDRGSRSASCVEGPRVHDFSDAPIPGSRSVVRKPAHTARKSRTKRIARGEDTR
jgi:hypothetical protein